MTALDRRALLATTAASIAAPTVWCGHAHCQHWTDYKSLEARNLAPRTVGAAMLAAVVANKARRSSAVI